MREDPLSSNSQLPLSTMQVPFIGFLSSVHQRLANRDRNAFWVSAAVVLASFLAVVLSAYLLIRDFTWQHVVLVVITAVVLVCGIVSLLLVRRGQARRGMWLLLLGGSLSVALSPIFMSGLGVYCAIGIAFAFLSVGNLALPQGDDTRANLLGILIGVGTLLLDGFVTFFQIPAPSELVIFASVIAALLALAYLLILSIYFSFYNVRTKIIVAVFGAAIISVTTLALINNSSARSNLLDAANGTLRLIANQTATEVDAYLASLAQIVAAQAESSTLSFYLTPDVEQSPADVRRYLRTQQVESGANLYFVIDREGAVVLHTSIVDLSTVPPFMGLPVSLQSSLQQTLASGMPYISPVLFSEIAGQEGQSGKGYILVANRIQGIDPVNNNRTIPLGVLVGSFPLTKIQETVESVGNLESNATFAVLYDENHMRIVHSLDREHVFTFVSALERDRLDILTAQDRVPSEYEVTGPENLAEGLESGAAYFAAAEIGVADGLNSVVTEKIIGRPWVVAIMQPQSIALQPVQAQTRNTMLVASGVTALTILISTIVGRMITAPLSNLTIVAQRAAAGNLYIQAPVESTDEIGSLSVAFNSMISQLRQTLTGLETRVEERTAELAQTSEQMAHRAARLQTVAEVAHTIAAEQDLETLLPLVARTISERFGYYHTGIFLLDEDREFAVLQASNSEGGQRMLERGHRLKVGQVGLVGYVTSEGLPRIALDVGKDAVFFDNPDLPNTRSEIALPLKIGDQVIGALDVQSEMSQAFSEDDVALLSTLTDQVSMAISNARLFGETRRALRELQVAQRQYLRQEWGSLMVQRRQSGYAYQLGNVRPLDAVLSEHAWDVLDATSVPAGDRISSPIQTEQEGSAEESFPGLLVPIRLRGEVIGLINLEDPAIEHIWSPAEIQLANSVADQVGLALENARLLEETQRRAERERLVSEITTRLRATNDPQVILDTAISELKHALGARQVQVVMKSKAGSQPAAGSSDEIPPAGTE